MKFAFLRRETVETLVWVEAEHETAAWAHLIDGAPATVSADARTVRKPIFNRAPLHDEFNL